MGPGSRKVSQARASAKVRAESTLPLGTVALTGADPMDPADRGKVRKIADAWLRWGRANGYRW
jgi:hypothetical protein